MTDRFFQKNVLLKDHTTYKIGGPAKYFFIAKSKEDLLWALKEARVLKIPVFIFAGGSNILFSDKGFKGLAIKLQNTGLSQEGDCVFIEAGEKLNDLVNFCQDSGLSGLEWSAGIPGTVGGAIYGNAQAFGGKTSDSVKSVQVLDLKTLKIKTLSNKQCQFSLKTSIFKKKKNLIILSAVFSVGKADKELISQKIKEYIDYRNKNHPLGWPSCGSVFINPKNEHAGCLIEKSGLAGKKIGKAQISPKHSNFIINLGGAKSSDVLKLIKLAQKKVKAKFKLLLKPEVQIVK